MWQKTTLLELNIMKIEFHASNLPRGQAVMWLFSIKKYHVELKIFKIKLCVIENLLFIISSSLQSYLEMNLQRYLITLKERTIKCKCDYTVSMQFKKLGNI